MIGRTLHGAPPGGALRGVARRRCPGRGGPGRATATRRSVLALTLAAPVLAALLLGACGGGPRPPAQQPWEQSGDLPEGWQASPAAGPAQPAPDAGARDEGPLTGEHAGRTPVATLRGRASYYHDSLAGNRTANGETYELAAFTAASRDLPFGTIVRVTREPEGPSVIVRVNDRGPFGDRRRILDLSRAAAEHLDMIRAGVIDVRADILLRPDR